MNKTALRLVAVLVFALSTSACSTIDDLIGDDTPAAGTPTADANGFPPVPADTADAGAPTSPDLASVPDKPSGTTTPDAQREVADSLAADRAKANYSAEALRGGTEAAAPPPGPAPAPGTAVADASPPQPEPAAAPPAADATPAPAPADNAPPAAAPTTPVAAAPVAAAPVAPPPAAAAAGGQPAVPAVGTAPGLPTRMADAQLGFKRSSAPPLDPNISQFVARPIISRYEQTASNAGIAVGPVAPSDTAVAEVSPRLKRGKMRAVGGPEVMGGSVVANLDVLNAPSPSVYANAAGLPPTAVVLFPGDGTKLTAAGREQVRAAVTAFQERGGTGFIKVVGHSSSRTANMPVEKHLEEIFNKSQARANAVAAEIIRQGVPASRVLVDAVGDSQPVYYESMPQGEDGNRRAEIFIQG